MLLQIAKGEIQHFKTGMKPWFVTLNLFQGLTISEVLKPDAEPSSA